MRRLAATCLLLGYALNDVVAMYGVPASPQPGDFEPSAWYFIGKDGQIVVTCGKSEMGQHISSTMAQLIAEG